MKVKGVIVEFPGSDRKYSYLCGLDDVKVGDMVVVEARDTYSIATITDLGSFAFSKMQLKWVVSKVDLTGLEACKSRWVEMQKVREAMNERKQLLEEKAIYDILAKEDDTMKALVEKLSELEAGTGQ